MLETNCDGDMVVTVLTVGHQDQKYVTNIEILTQTSKNGHQHLCYLIKTLFLDSIFSMFCSDNKMQFKAVIVTHINYCITYTVWITWLVNEKGSARIEKKSKEALFIWINSVTLSVTQVVTLRLKVAVLKWVGSHSIHNVLYSTKCVGLYHRCVGKEFK